MEKEIEEFVAAADRLVNLLATQVPANADALKRHELLKTRAYDAYDAAREALTGEMVDQEANEGEQ